MNTAIGDALKDYSTTEEVNSAIDGKLADYSTTTQMNSAINTAKSEVQSEFNTKFESYSTTEQMNAAIDSAIAENDALVYKGVVTVNDETGEDNLPTSEVRIGHVYKVSKTGYYGPEDELCYVGDLLIANSSTGAENADGYIDSENLTWDHVDSGYEDESQARLSGDNGNIYLTSPVANENNKGDLGTIAVMSMNENLKVAVSANAITMSLEWGSFETAE
jgi:hypothetical protein